MAGWDLYGIFKVEPLFRAGRGVYGRLHGGPVPAGSFSEPHR
ncbi:hypothetical protein MICRO11B_370009 [Micrococcus luteus]|nr:hypothetical protein MICRO11B_370009 [Micrococcus luteus]